MAEDLTVQLLAVQQSAGREFAQITVIRKQHELEMAVVDMVGEVSRKAPAAAGTGRIVDKHA